VGVTAASTLVVTSRAALWVGLSGYERSTNTDLIDGMHELVATASVMPRKRRAIGGAYPSSS
jgi:hypothetical protein